MMDGEDLFDDDLDNDDLLLMLEQHETQYANTQQQEPARNVLYPEEYTPRQASTITCPIPVHESTLGNVTNWDRSVFLNAQDSQQDASMIEGLQFTLERMKAKMDQDSRSLGLAEEDLKRCTTELAFKTKELESARAELKLFRKKNQDSALSSAASDSMMVVEDTEANDAPRRRSGFPSLAEFAFAGTKRPRLSMTPNLENLRIRESASPGPTQHDIEQHVNRQIKQGIQEAKHQLMQDIQLQREHDQQQLVFNLYACLAGLDFIDASVDNQNRCVTTETMSTIDDQLQQAFVPKEPQTKTDVKMAALSSQLVYCFAGVSRVGIDATIMQANSLLKALLRLAMVEIQAWTIIRSVQLLCALVQHYDAYIAILCQELRQDDGKQESAVHAMMQCLVFLTRDYTQGSADMGHLLGTMPDMSSVTYADAKQILQQYPLGRLNAFPLSTGTSLAVCEKSSILVLEAMATVLESKHATDLDCFALALEQGTFTSLMHSTQPLPIAFATAKVLHQLLLKNLLEPKYQLQIIGLLLQVLRTARPAPHLERLWYEVRMLCMAILTRSVVEVTLPLTVANWCEHLLPTFFEIIKDEADRYQLSNAPPFPLVHHEQLLNLIGGAMFLASFGMTKHPRIVDMEDGETYMQILTTLTHVKPLVDSQYPEDDHIHSDLKQLGQLLFTKQQSNVSTPQPDPALIPGPTPTSTTPKPIVKPKTKLKLRANP
ncbi:hypothetical protein DM01DRAFT_1341118 [Hesseltinella vesiculosa]|uniref:Uncharacterized protein n=1 Tax=Hesseltinella vesiculosa TaxID=101127 RepID=A0A1X2G213_9FUNG|nr:hypothetical protein DM01DRAFT_1341118 [Hesseltinella vesiculosa]